MIVHGSRLLAVCHGRPVLHGKAQPTARARARNTLVAVGALLALMGLVCHGVTTATWPHEAMVLFTTAARCTAGRRREASSGDDPDVATGVACASYARFSSDMQREDSISDQQRVCRETAQGNGHTISPQLEFSDAAVSGTKLRREGLDRLLAAAKAGEFQVLYFYSLSRLARESVITMPVLKTLVYNHGVRVISTSEGMDSEQQGWEILATVLSVVHEQYIKDLANAVRRGQEGALLAGYSVGDYCFGYTSVPVPGSESGRRGRDAKPRMVYAVDLEAAKWVSRIYHWFVHERRPLRWIAREMNRLGAPKDHRATTPHWRHQYLTRLLSNRKYIGDWQWGGSKNVRDPNTGSVRQVDRGSEDLEQWRRHLPHLELVDRETFELAQQYLAENRTKHVGHRRRNGQLAGSPAGTNRQQPRHLLSGIIQCRTCGETFLVGGPRGKYLHCPGWHKGTCSCQTQLNRQRAERLIVAAINQRVLAKSDWKEAVLDEMSSYVADEQRRLPAELETVEKTLTDVSRKIARLVDAIEEGQATPDVTARLAQRRREKQQLEATAERLRRHQQERVPTPTAAWVETQLQELSVVLSGDAPAAALALQQLAKGQIVVEEIRREGRQRHFLRGRFTLTLSGIIAQVGSQFTSAEQAQKDASELVEEITIDFVDTSPLDAVAEQAKQLYDQEWLMTDIAEELNVSRGKATKLIQHWFESRGLPKPDGRARRAQLPQKHKHRPLYQQIADEVMRLWQQDLLLGDIATQLNVDRNTITAAVGYWHESRGMPVPDGRPRRKALEKKAFRPRHQGTPTQTAGACS